MGQKMAEPFLVAFQLDGGRVANPPKGVPAGPWCNVALHTIAGLSSADAGKLKAEPCRLIADGLRKFEHQHPKSAISSDGSLETTCFSYVEPSQHGIKGSQFCPMSVDCKMIDATRVAKQLDVPTNRNITCADVNRKA